MFAFEKAQKEEQAIQTLLAISQNEEKGIVTQPESSISNLENGVKKRYSGKPSLEEEYQLSPWEGSENEKLLQIEEEGRISHFSLKVKIYQDF